MVQAPRVGIRQPARRLDRDAQDALLHSCRFALIERPVVHAVPQAAAVHPFRKDGRHTAYLTHVVAGYDVGMQTQVDPVLALPEERLFALLTPFSKVTRLRPLHSQIGIPVLMMYFPYAAHAAVNSIRDHPVGLEQSIAHHDLFIGDRPRLLSGS